MVFNSTINQEFLTVVLSLQTLNFNPLTFCIRGACRDSYINHLGHDATAIFMVLEPYQLVGKSTCHGTIKETRLKISAVIKKEKTLLHEQYRDILLTDLGIQIVSFSRSSKYKSTIKL